MTLEDIYYVGQTVAVVAILGSLFAVITQLRQATKQIKSAHETARQTALRDQIEGLERMTRTIYETPGLAAVLLRGNQGLGGLSDEERLRYITFCTTAFRVWERLHVQYVAGQIDADLWTTHINELRAQASFQGAKEVWALRGSMFSDAFQQFMKGLEPGAAGEVLTGARAAGGVDVSQP